MGTCAPLQVVVILNPLVHNQAIRFIEIAGEERMRVRATVFAGSLFRALPKEVIETYLCVELLDRRRREFSLDNQLGGECFVCVGGWNLAVKVGRRKYFTFSCWKEQGKGLWWVRKDTKRVAIHGITHVVREALEEGFTVTIV